ncbi:MAG: hypothetical protein IKG30_00315 [Clostridiales bacterium]|nr:hypothetical protein [Clostridiales bacterium]
MLRKKIISGLLIGSVLLGVAACSKGKDKDNTNQDTGLIPVSDTNGTGGNSVSGNNGSSDSGASGADPGSDITLDSGSGSSGGGISSADMVQVPASENVLFKYTYHNMAWSWQSSVTFILCNGDVYTFEDNISARMSQNANETELSYIREYAEPTAHLSRIALTELYNACLKVDPNVSTTMESTGNDMGEYKFVYVDQETFEEIPITITGDWTLKTDDPALNYAMELVDKTLASIPLRNVKLQLYLNSTLINVPYDGSALVGTHLVFTDFDELIEFCEDYGVEIGMNEETRTLWKQAKYMLLQVFDTDRRADGVLIRNDSELRILPTLSEYEYDPYLDGKICVAIWRFDEFEEGKYVDENGDPWEVYGETEQV